MPSKSKHTRVKARINSILERKLSTYFAAAGAAGAGLLAVAQPAEAHVVYTPANVTIQGGVGSIPIDLNGDGVVDFTIEFADGPKSLFVDIIDGPGNGVRLNGSLFAAAGFFGLPVAPGEKFGTSYQAMAVVGGYGTFNFAYGPWLNVTNRYLGFRFQIAGQTHYGWARVNCDITTDTRVTLTGYAYDTTANHPIKEGSISGPAEVGRLGPAEMLAPKPQPASLGLLARGSDGLVIWRREEGAA